MKSKLVIDNSSVANDVSEFYWLSSVEWKNNSEWRIGKDMEGTDRHLFQNFPGETKKT